MTIQEKHDALLAYCVRDSKSVDAAPQARLYIDQTHQLPEVLAECDLKDIQELRSYIESLSDMGFLEAHLIGGPRGLQYKITMEGFRRAEALGV